MISYNIQQGVTTPYTTSIQRVAEAIRTGVFHGVNGDINLKREKKYLPVFGSAMWEQGSDNIQEKNIKAFYGIMVFDIDQYEKDDPVLNKKYYDTIRRVFNKYLLMMFRSPNGGIKFILKTDIRSTDPAVYKVAYKKLLKIIIGYGISADHLDRQTCNIGRVTRMPFDENVYFNINCHSIKIEEKAKAQARKNQEELERQIKINAARVGEIDKDRARAEMEEVLRALPAYIYSSNRNTALAHVAWKCFSCGLDVFDLIGYYETMKSQGNLDSDVNTPDKIKAQAERQFKNWQNAGGYVNSKFRVRDFASNKATINNLLKMALEE